MTVQPIFVSATDPETGDEHTELIEPGCYVVIPVEPMYLAHTQVHRNGTVVLTLKRRPA
jgi:hypothetical protein